MSDTVAIRKWKELSGDAWDSLLLGNGASIALHRGFNYSSLYQVAKKKDYLRKAKPLFTALDTTDFEYVLLACWYANRVNSALGNPSPKISCADKEVRSALIESVKAVHPAHNAICPALKQIGAFASKFETVVTLNYDLTLYWAMMLFNESNDTWFKDAFINNGKFEPDWSRLRENYQDAKGSTMVFYQHGSLILARDNSRDEVKLAASDSANQSNLLETITGDWRKGTHVPIFVSEGDTSSKLEAIRRSPYLSAVYNDVLTKLGDGVVVYGFSFSGNDTHILEALNKKNPPQRMAVSVYTGQPCTNQQSYCHHVLAQMKCLLPCTELKFFDAASPGCWSNKPAMEN